MSLNSFCWPKASVPTVLILRTVNWQNSWVYIPEYPEQKYKLCFLRERLRVVNLGKLFFNLSFFLFQSFSAFPSDFCKSFLIFIVLLITIDMCPLLLCSGSQLGDKWIELSIWIISRTRIQKKLMKWNGNSRAEINEVKNKKTTEIINKPKADSL